MSFAIELILISSLGFLGSFGHCAGMCGGLAISFTLSSQNKDDWLASWRFHLLLNLGRVISYALVGIALGSFGALLFTAQLKQIMGFITGLLLIWLGISRIAPDKLPRLPIIHPIQGKLHQKFSLKMGQIANTNFWWTPLILGLFWGLIPCGFLYTAQLKAAEAGSITVAVLTMLAFGIGTMPTMVGVGVSADRLSVDRRSQLFRLGGWITLAIGILTLLRTQATIDYTGHCALLLLMLALIARPISKWWSAPLQYRRIIGVGSYLFAIAHTLHMMEHSLDWNLQSIPFMLVSHQQGLLSGIVALILMTPAAFTSSDRLQKLLGNYWRKLHLLSVPALVLVILHAILIGSHYLGKLNVTWQNQVGTVILIVAMLVVLVMRSLPTK